MNLLNKQKLDTFQNSGGSGRAVYMAVAVEPDPTTVSSFNPYTHATDWCVALAVAPPLPNQSATELTTVDTAHGTPHIDRYWTAAGGPNGANSLNRPNWGLDDGENFVLGNYRLILQDYVTNHGSP